MRRWSGLPATLIGLHFNQFIEPGYHELARQGFDAAWRGEAETCETRGTHADGYAYHLEITNLPVTLDGEAVGVYGICRDVTERNRQTNALRLLSRGVDASPSGMLMVAAERTGDSATARRNRASVPCHCGQGEASVLSPISWVGE